MEIIIHGDKLKITDAMKEYIEEKLEKLNKYLENSDNVRATVIVKVKNHEQRVEITIPLKAVILRSEEAKDDFYAAVDKTIDKLERQIRKNKTRIMARQNKTNIDFVVSAFEEEAILQMELLGHQFYMYKDSETNQPAVVYKRTDGNYGVIESE